MVKSTSQICSGCFDHITLNKYLAESKMPTDNMDEQQQGD